MRRFDPVTLPPERVPRRGVSVTLAGRFNACPRSAYLHMLYDGGPASHEMQRGSVLHRVIELAIEAMVNEGEPVIPPEIVKAVVNDVLADPRFPCPVEEHDYIRECAYRWAREAVVDAQALVACETLFELDIAGTTLRAKIDRADLLEGGAVCAVEDFKSSRAMVGFEDIGRKRPDGTVAAKDFQLVSYALALAFGVPVRIEDPCGDGSGRSETREPFPVASTAQRFDLSYVYPGIEINEKMGRRTVSLTRLELEEYRASLGSLLVRFQRALESGDWPAVPGSHCSTCPARQECPIPAHLLRSRIDPAAEDPADVAVYHAFLDAAAGDLREEIKEWVLDNGPLRFGRDLVWDFDVSTSDRIDDKDAMWAAIERQRLYGEPFDRDEFVKKVVRTDFRVRRLTEDEMATETEGSK